MEVPYGRLGGIKNTTRSPRAEGEARSPRAKGWYFWYHPSAHMVIPISYSVQDKKTLINSKLGIEVKAKFSR